MGCFGERARMIRPVKPDEVAALAQLQLDALPGSLPNRLGRRFLETYYRALLGDPAFFCDVYVVSGRLVGFFTYSSDAAGAFKRALHRHFASFAVAVVASVLTRPTRIPTLIRILRSLAPGYRELADDVPAEILSLGVLPEYRGISIGRQLVEHALNVLDRRNVRRIKAATKIQAEDPRIYNFFARHGFRSIGTVMRHGGRRNMLIRVGRPKSDGKQRIKAVVP